MSPADRTYTFDDLVSAWLDHRQWRSKHADLADWHTGRYEAMSRAFGVDLREPPKTPPARPDWMTPLDLPVAFQREDPRWHQRLHRLMESAADREQRITSPFDDYLEAPPSIARAYEHFGSALGGPLHDARQALTGVVRDLAALLYPEAAPRVVTAAEIHAQGWDPTAVGPDPVDYW